MKVSKNTVWVFDLDDTLYSEAEYQASGYAYLAERINELYNVDVRSVIQSAIADNKDVLVEICQFVSLPLSVKESLLWMYRLHKPDIKLTDSVKSTLAFIESNALASAILTDGRSYSQRSKVHALGLGEMQCLVSEEWGETKPGKKRFVHIQQSHTLADKFIYVGDNIKKDFVTPNHLGWLTIGLKDKGTNIHPQNIDVESNNYMPQIWIEELSELKDFIC
ncbi:HAD family hydrolase [Enterovibrio norvegicus]|uniref:Putative hydrolase of the HAD superfamily n=1 Tax=Enterovibrio norvegicus DSM 15893 TaxID=1121869 RepID=A0A1I5N9Y5_9GAMM|nr:HAD-IA family hydrolase [Enterovibrio norvegicus]SFP18502.1 putative hydrolase of the HAD superfamily [Enterovibrio norvegicus DSM 15893]